MEHYFNENLLYAFIYRYYPFKDLTEELVKSGEILVQMILMDMIDSDQNLWKLKTKSIKDVAHSVSKQFSYRIGGDTFFYGAFGNFYSAILQNHHFDVNYFNSNHNVSQLFEKKIKNQHLFLQQLKNIQFPLRDRLKEIAFIQNITNNLPLINLQQLANKKINYILKFINIQETEQKTNKKKYRKKQTKKQNTPKSECLKSFYSCSKIEEQRVTEADEFQTNMLSSQSLMIPQKNQLQTKNEILSQKMGISNKYIKRQLKTQDKLILNYDDLLMVQKKKIKLKRNK